MGQGQEGHSEAIVGKGTQMGHMRAQMGHIRVWVRGQVQYEVSSVGPLESGEEGGAA